MRFDEESETPMILAEPKGILKTNRAPFRLAAKRDGRRLLIWEVPGEVILRRDDGSTENFTEMFVDADPMTDMPMRFTTGSTSCWHKIERDAGGEVTKITSILATEKPEEETGVQYLETARITRHSAKHWSILTLVEGSYTLDVPILPPEVDPPAESPAPLPPLPIPPSSASGDPDAPSSGSLSAPVSGSSGSSDSSDSSKSAIVPFGSKYIGWFIAEQPSPQFSESIQVRLASGVASIDLAPEWETAVDHLRVVSVLASDAPALLSASISERRLHVCRVRGDAETCVVTVQGRPRAAHVSAPRWRRYSKAHYERNLRFWAQAH